MAKRIFLFSRTETLAGLGLVRTFQNVELFGQMTVLENVMVGLHTRSKSGIFSCAFKLPGQIKEEKYIREKSMEWLEFTGMADLADMTGRQFTFWQGKTAGNFPGAGRRTEDYFNG